MNVLDFIKSHPTEIIIVMMIIIIVLIIILIIDIHSHHETFVPNLTKIGKLNIDGEYYKYDGKVQDLQINVLENDLVCLQIPNTNKLMNFNKVGYKTSFVDVPNATDILADTNSQNVFQMKFINSYEFNLIPRRYPDCCLAIDGFTNRNSCTENRGIDRYAVSFISDNKPLTYKDLNIPYTSDKIIYRKVEFTCPAKNVELHKNGDENQFNNDNSLTMLHWWNGAKNHPNSKHYLIYNINDKTFEVFRVYNNKRYRLNVYGVASGCTTNAPLKLHSSGKTNPDNNELFKFKWYDNNLFSILTKCNNGNVGVYGNRFNRQIKNYGIAHDKEIRAGTYIAPAELKMNIYSIPNISSLTQIDFIITKITAFKKLLDNVKSNGKGVVNVIKKTMFDDFPNKQIPITKEGKYIMTNEEKYNKYTRFNMKYNGVNIDSRLNVYNIDIPQNNFMFYQDNDGNIRTVGENLIIIPKDYIKSLDDKKLMLSKPIYGDGRYCSGCRGFSDLGRINHIYINESDAPPFTCCKKAVKFTEITTIYIQGYKPAESETEIKTEITNIVSETENENKTNLKYKAYYLIPKNKNGFIYLECSNSSPSQQFKFNTKTKEIKTMDGKLILKLGEHDEFKINNTTGEGTLTLRDNMLFGDGRYFRGNIAKVDESRVREIYLKQSDMPIKKSMGRNHTGYCEIRDLKFDKLIKS